MKDLALRALSNVQPLNNRLARSVIQFQRENEHRWLGRRNEGKERGAESCWISQTSDLSYLYG
jgi:hypothetical protein